jgi:hypothetical protein
LPASSITSSINDIERIFKKRLKARNTGIKKEETITILISKLGSA